MILKLIIKILIFTSIVLIVSYSTLYLNPDYKKEYVAGVIPKLDKLKSIKNKKIVIIGGSNASFGIDTDMMERQLRVPVVNLALHGGLPIKYIFEQARPYMKKNDILIISKEYSGLKSQYWDQMSGIELPKIATYDISQIKVILSNRKLFESTVTGLFKTIKYYLDKYPIEGKNGKKSVYSLDAFANDNLKSEFIIGDYDKKVKEHSLPKLNNKSILMNGLKEYKEYFHEKNIEIYLTPPVIIKGYYKDKGILPFWKHLSQFSEIPMLNENKKYTLDRKYFFNSHYHTNDVGRELRTKSLIEDILIKDLVPIKGKVNLPVYVTNKVAINKANLSLFNKKLNFKVLKRDGDGILIKQSGDLNQNYFRMQLKNKDYKGYNFCLNLKCDKTVINSIKFRGTGKLEEFDSIIELENNVYKLWKKVNNVYFTDNNSYLGISFPNDDKLIDKEFLIQDVGLFEELGMNDSITDIYPIPLKGNNDPLFEVISVNHTVYLKDILIATNVADKITLTSNKLYCISRKKNTITITDFYSNKLIFETKNEIIIKSSLDNVVKVFE